MRPKAAKYESIRVDVTMELRSLVKVRSPIAGRIMIAATQAFVLSDLRAASSALDHVID